MTAATQKTPGTAVATAPVNPSQVAIDDPELRALFEADAGIGSQDMGKDDKVTPFLGLIQGLSPQIDPNKPQYIEGARIGNIFNTVTGEVYTSIRVIPVMFQKVYNAWVPRDLGGGFLGSYMDSELQIPIFVPPNQNTDGDQPVQIVETANWYVLAEGLDGTWAPAILSMTSTKLKASRKWGTLTTIAANKYASKNGPAPIFACIYTLGSASETNEKGTFANYKIENSGPVSVDLYLLAKAFRALIESGVVKADMTKSDTAATADDAADDKNAKY